MAISFDFSDRVAIVTGGSSGLGAAIALGLAKGGAAVCVTGRDEARLAAMEQSLRAEGVEALGIAADVTKPEQIEAAVNTVLDRFGKIDILVNSAGVFRFGEALDLGLGDWNEIIATNLTGTFLFCQAAGRAMIARGYGRIVNIASADSFIAVNGEAAYCSSKAGVLALTKVLGVEWVKRGVVVNGVAPCDFETPMLEPFLQDPAFVEWRLNAIPAGRIGKPAELVPAVLFLASEEASMVVGHTMLVDGGVTLI